MHKKKRNTDCIAEAPSMRWLCRGITALAIVLIQSCTGTVKGEYPAGIASDTGLVQTATTSEVKTDTSSNRVYVCNSSHIGAYHKNGCRALKRCKAGSIKLSLSQAINRGYRACQLCQ